MQASVTIRATASGASESMPAIVDAQTTPLSLDIQILGSSDLPDNAELILTAHELFGRTTKVLPDALPHLSEAVGTTTHLTVEPDELQLSPGLWHVLVDVMCGEQSLAGTDAGSTEIYIRSADESSTFTSASCELGRAEYAFERDFGTYFPSYNCQLPATIDPFSDQDADEFQKLFADDNPLSLDTLHDAGVGVLLAAEAYRTMDCGDRVGYCEEITARLVRVVFEFMTGEDGQTHSLKGVSENRQHDNSTDTFSSLALSFLSRVYFYFRQEPINNKDYARYVLSNAKNIFRHLLAQYELLIEDKSESTCNPRVLAGLASYCLSHKTEHGQFFSTNAENALLDGSMLLAEALQDDKPLFPRSNNPTDTSDLVHALSGLLAVYHISQTLKDRGHDKAATAVPQLKAGIERVRQQLLHVPADSPSPPLEVPSRLLGTLYAAACQYSNTFGHNFSENRFSEQFAKRQQDKDKSYLAELNAAGAELRLCPEYYHSPRRHEDAVVLPV